MAEMKNRKTSNAYTRSETSARQSYTNDGMLSEAIESNTENEGRDTYFSKRKKKRSWGRNAYSKRASKKKPFDNEYDDDFRMTVDNLFDFVSKINKHAKKAATKKNKKKKGKDQPKKKYKYEKAKKKKMKVDTRKDNSLYRFEKDSVNLNLQEFIRAQNNNNPLLYQMMLNPNNGYMKPAQGTAMYNQNVVKMTELMNQLYNVYGGMGQNHQAASVENLLLQINPQLKQNPEILNTFKAMMQGNTGQLPDMSMHHANVNSLYTGQPSNEGFSSINKFPLPKAAYHVGIAYHIWYKEGNLDKDPTQYARKVKQMIMRKSHMDENQTPTQTNQSEDLPQGQTVTPSQRQQSDPGTQTGNMEEENVHTIKDISSSVQNDPTPKKPESANPGAMMVEERQVNPATPQMPTTHAVTPSPVKRVTQGAMQVENHPNTVQAVEPRLETPQNSNLNSNLNSQKVVLTNPNAQKVSLEIPSSANPGQVQAINPQNHANPPVL